MTYTALSKSGRLEMREIPFRLTRARRINLYWAVIARGNAMHDTAWLMLCAFAWTALLLCLCLSVGCFSGAPAESRPEPFVVGTVFSPGPGADTATRQALARLTLATGVEFSVGDGGIAVNVLPEVIGPKIQPDGSISDGPICAVTPITYRNSDRALVAVRIDVATGEPGCWDLSHTIEHEMVHALRAAFTSAMPVVDQMADHSLDGVFQAYGGEGHSALLEEESLTKVCEVVDCTRFQPEGAPLKLAPSASTLPQDEPEPAPQYLRLSPTADMLSAVESAAERYLSRGILIEVGAGGVPVALDDGIVNAQALAHYGRWCHGSGCNTGHGAWIHVRSGLGDLLPNSIDHEIAHVLSGWGGCDVSKLPMADDMHLTRGNVVSNGNSGYASMVWTADDQALVESCNTGFQPEGAPLKLAPSASTLPQDEPAAVQAPEVVAPVVEAVAVPAPLPVVTFSIVGPDVFNVRFGRPNLHTSLATALARWSAATCRELVMVPEGGQHSVSWGDSTTIKPGRLGQTTGTWEHALIQSKKVNEGTTPIILAHELGHLLARSDTHATDGVYSDDPFVAGANVITAADLAKVCASFECACFQPEE